jgi:fatty-acyl-CoA synthase
MTGAPRFAGAADIAAFAGTKLEKRLGGQDLLTLLDQRAREQGEAPAVHYVPSGKAADGHRSYSRRQLVDAAAAFARRLAECGIGRRDVVASLLPNGPGTLAACLGTMAVGVLAPINLYLEPAQIRKLLSDCCAKVVLLPKEAPGAIANALALVQPQDGEQPAPIIVDTETLAESPVASLPGRGLADRVALFHTGGTTGLPKFVPLTARNLAAGAIVSQFAYGYATRDHVLCAMPMFHVGGLFACSLFPLAAGSSVVVLGPLGYRGEGVVTALPTTLALTAPSVVIGPPTIMAQIAANPPARGALPNLRLFVNGAAALPRSVGLRLAEVTAVPLVEPWGLTEATLAVTSGPRDGARRQGSVGLALPYCAVKAVRTDAEGRAVADCGVDEIGVLAVRGPMVFDGYLDRAPDQQPFFADGWLDTGDLGRIDEDGFVWVTGRAKELIKRGGHGIDPGMIEDAFAAHEAVALAAAVGKPDAYAGEMPVVYVELRPGATADPDGLIEFARLRIAERAAVPREVVILPSLPVTAVGKVHKQSLKIDITRRAVEELVRGVVGAAGTFEVVVQPHPLHGLEARVQVSRPCVDAVRQVIGALPLRSTIIACQGLIAEDRA